MSTTKPKCIIVDLDGTLCDLEHRRHFVINGNKDWKSFAEACWQDTPNIWCVELVKAMKAAHYRIVFVSGRMEGQRKTTEDWLKTHMEFLVNADYKLFMRQDKDYRPDTEIKKELYDACIQTYFETLFVVDDRKSVADMWRKEGLIVLHCAEGDF